MDFEINSLLTRIDALHGAAHWDEVLLRPSDQAVKDAAIAVGALTQPYRRFLVRPGTDPRIVRARHFRGRLTCASAAEVLGYRMWNPPEDVHIALPPNHAVRDSTRRPLAGVRIHRPVELTPATVIPTVVPAPSATRVALPSPPDRAAPPVVWTDGARPGTGGCFCQPQKSRPS